MFVRCLWSVCEVFVRCLWGVCRMFVRCLCDNALMCTLPPENMIVCST